MTHPALNACLNTTSACLLVAGYVLIRQGRREAHKTCMLAATCVSAVFLASYLLYHFQVGHVAYSGPHKALYLAILLPHIAGAFAIVPLVILVLRHALKGNLEKHKRIARWTLPIWLYVSVTGVAVYWMLYG